MNFAKALIACLMGATKAVMGKNLPDDESFQLHMNTHAEHRSGCPTLDSGILPSECVELVIPPFPMCKNKNVKEWMALAYGPEGGAPCCSEDNTDCGCPVKNTPRFKKSAEMGCSEFAMCQEAFKVYALMNDIEAGTMA